MRMGLKWKPQIKRIFHTHTNGNLYRQRDAATPGKILVRELLTDRLAADLPEDRISVGSDRRAMVMLDFSKLTLEIGLLRSKIMCEVRSPPVTRNNFALIA